jgi:hypothetical protein
MPTETPVRATENDSWETQDLTSECDVELDTITADLQVETRRLAAALVEAPAAASSSD